MRFNIVATIALAVPMVSAYSVESQWGAVEMGEAASTEARPANYKDKACKEESTSPIKHEDTICRVKDGVQSVWLNKQSTWCIVQYKQTVHGQYKENQKCVGCAIAKHQVELGKGCVETPGPDNLWNIYKGDCGAVEVDMCKKV